MFYSPIIKIIMYEESGRVIISKLIPKKTRWWQLPQTEYVQYYMKVDENGYVVYEKIIRK